MIDKRNMKNVFSKMYFLTYNYLILDDLFIIILMKHLKKLGLHEIQVLINSTQDQD